MAKIHKTDPFYKGFQNPTSFCLQQAGCDPFPQIWSRNIYIMYIIYMMYIYFFLFTDTYCIYRHMCVCKLTFILYTHTHTAYTSRTRTEVSGSKECFTVRGKTSFAHRSWREASHLLNSVLWVRPLLVPVLSTVATTSRLFAALLTGLGSFQFFSQLFSTVLSDLCSSFQIFPPLLNSSRDFSLLANSSQRLSSLSTSSQFFSTRLNSFHLSSTLPNSYQLGWTHLKCNFNQLSSPSLAPCDLFNLCLSWTLVNNFRIP